MAGESTFEKVEEGFSVVPCTLLVVVRSPTLVVGTRPLLLMLAMSVDVSLLLKYDQVGLTVTMMLYFSTPGVVTGLGVGARVPFGQVPVEG